MTTEEGQRIAKQNIETLKHFEAGKYPNTSHYLKGKGLRLDLIQFYEYASDKKIMIAEDQQCYCLIVDNVRLTNEVRKKYGASAEKTTNKRFNLICALGLLSKYKGDGLEPLNKIREEATAKKKSKQYHLPNTYIIKKYNSELLREIEERAKVLREKHIGVGNFKANTLWFAGVSDDIVRSALPYNNEDSLAGKINAEMFKQITAVIDDQIQKDGYTTKQKILESFPTVFRNEKHLTEFMSGHWEEIHKRYRYNRPTKDHKRLFNLDPDHNSFIFTNK